MKKFLWFAPAALVLGFTLPETGSSDETKIEKGKYLVTQVAMCVQCHSPRDAKAEIDRLSLFKGARIPVAPPFPNKQWALYAPRIAGLPGWEEEDFITLLVTGSRPTGEIPRAPMPPFRISREDASAIAAYLKSLR